ncbi:MAG: hypothetical protein H6981_11555 [Gammaproteobacteria bacterium]|nr:hypothetical protein [Gammaproteobacteria bacterium]MCP5137423.1 hypothetical protein [Gammaproteobacteria bacterium]
MNAVIGLLVGTATSAWAAWRALKQYAARQAGGATPAVPRPARKAPVPECKLDDIVFTEAHLRSLDASRLQGGHHIVQEATLPSGSTITLTRRSLTLIARDDLIINGQIRIAPIHNVTLDVTLVSVTGDIEIGVNALISGSPPKRASTQKASGAGVALSGESGAAGGNIRLMALSGSVRIKGDIEATPGRDGQSMDITAPPYLGIPTLAGGANARGGDGGGGGHVLICAQEKIEIGPFAALIAGGNGGDGGDADADACGGGTSRALAGSGGDAGQVWLTGTGNRPCLVTLANKAGIRAGDPGDGGLGVALSGGGGIAASSPAFALGGAGGNGGSVHFTHCVFQGPAANVVGGEGGYGGDADAVGGAGLAGWIGSGDAGGPALAHGGDAGKNGVAPACPLPNGAVANGTLVAQTPVGGGNAAALGGAGGGAGGWVFALAGTPGRATAQGGAGFRVTTKPPLVTVTTGAPATSAGNP